MLTHNELMSVLVSYWHLLPLEQKTSGDKLSDYIKHVYKDKRQAAVCNALKGSNYTFTRWGSGRVEVSYVEVYQPKTVR